MRTFHRLGVVFAFIICLGACSSGGSGPGSLPPPVTPAATRTWRMGFSPNPPRPTVQDVLGGIDLWSQRAEIAAIHEELPWRDLLSGMSADAILDRDKVQLVNYMRGKGLQLYFMADITDPLSRVQEAPQLRALGRSISEPAVQQVYRDYLLAVQRKLNPDYLGLAAETNLIRVAAPPQVYAAMVKASGDAAAALRAAGASEPLLISVQAETAWGLLGAPAPYRGVEADFADFPFAQMIGISSYPYFAYPQPEDIPANYYTRLLNGHTLPAMVVEGGWTSANVGSVQSSAEIQARYFTREAALLDSINARGFIQLVFADLDLASFPPPLPPNLSLFAQIGIVDTHFGAKPALAVWDALYARRRL